MAKSGGGGGRGDGTRALAGGVTRTTRTLATAGGGSARDVTYRIAGVDRVFSSRTGALSYVQRAKRPGRVVTGTSSMSGTARSSRRSSAASQRAYTEAQRQANLRV